MFSHQISGLDPDPNWTKYAGYQSIWFFRLRLFYQLNIYLSWDLTSQRNTGCSETISHPAKIKMNKLWTIPGNHQMPFILQFGQAGKKSSSKPQYQGDSKPDQLLFCYWFHFVIIWSIFFVICPILLILLQFCCYWLHFVVIHSILLIFLAILLYIFSFLFLLATFGVFILLLVHVVVIDSIWLFLIPCFCYCFHVVVIDSMLLLLYPNSCLLIRVKSRFYLNGLSLSCIRFRFFFVFKFSCFSFMLLLLLIIID